MTLDGRRPIIEDDQNCLPEISFFSSDLKSFKQYISLLLRKRRVLGCFTFLMSAQIYCKQTILSWTKKFIATLGLS